jgi:RNA polymerase sigma-70 factor (ECF subfamily)
MNGWPATARPSDLAKLAAVNKDRRASIPSHPDNHRSREEPLLPNSLAQKSAPSRAQSAENAADFDIHEWTKAISRGDEAAFTRFYDQYSLRLYRYLLVLGKGNEAEASEVLQTVVIKLAKRFRVFDDETRMWHWLCRLAQNSYVDLWRAKRRDERLVPLQDQLHHAESSQKFPEEHVLAAGLDHSLEQLDEEDRELMRAVYVDRRPLQELANATGQTYKAVESRLARLRRKLKTNLLNFLRHENR